MKLSFALELEAAAAVKFVASDLLHNLLWALLWNLTYYWSV